ncbi:DNA-binding protein [Methylorubrum populi]|uniref:DNA-binding protein n=1 Tax=Methylobacterium radiotolerans TaxID=31998 RepID=A0ABU7TGC1_9HYPH
MLRNRVRRPFTVEAKSTGQNRFVSIPSKVPSASSKRAGQAAAMPWPPFEPAETGAASGAEVAAEQRRVLPNLLVPPPPEPEPEPVVDAEVLPRVRRVPAPVPTGEAPRRRGRPRKVPIAPVAEPALTEPPVAKRQVAELALAARPLVEPRAPEPEPTAPPAIVRRRMDREGSERLGRAERWKRRLPRACW